MSNARIGTVLRIDAKVCHVEIDGQRRMVPLRGRLFEERGHARNPVAVGDRVQLGSGETGEQDGDAIEAVLPRSSKLARRSKGEEDREQVIAANISLVLVVASLRDPQFQTLLVDRIFAACARQDLRAELVITKIDRDRDDNARELIELYRGIGYRVHPTSIIAGYETHDTLTELGQLLHTNTTVLTGLSGAGKSSLLNTLVPGLALRVGQVSRVQHGRHTTTAAELFPLPEGGYVLDTPGIRNFVFFGVAPSELTFYFPEFAAASRGCGFRNCTHHSEPDCAVLRDIAAGTIGASRYASYRHLYSEVKEADRRERHGEN